MYMIHVKDKDLVVPGEILAEEGYYSGRGTFKDGQSVCSSLMGIVSLRNKKISVIPLKSKYVPKKGDVVIGEIDDIRFSMWGVDVNSPYSGILPASEVFGREKRELGKVFKIGDVLFLRVVDVDEVKKVKLGLKGRGMGKFKGGILVDITPTKVPRLIGKKGSMINMIKDKTKCKIVVGQNGLVWVKGEKEMEQITKTIIHLIEAEAHTSGLTNRIRDKLYLLVDGKLPEKQEEEFEISVDDIDLTDNNEELRSDVPETNENIIANEDNSENILERPKLEDIVDESENKKEFESFEISENSDSNNKELELESSFDSESENSDESSKVRKTSYLDTFNHLKTQNNPNKTSFSEINESNESTSPTLNISNSTIKENTNKSKKRNIGRWRKKT